ncbi:MAG: alkaline phosphatase [Prevotella sp.]|nr:alkaline phosphatase [Prevotella sp.]
MKMKNILLTLALAACAMGAAAQQDNIQTFTFDNPYTVEKIKAPKGKKVKNVVLMIGDGMSLMHIQAAWTCNRGHLWLENAQATGLSETPATDRLVTDSGSGGTSLATGYKTVYHAVGVDPQGKPLTTLIDLAKQAGKDAGVAVTCRLWDATPGDFLGHNIDRDFEEDIVGCYPESNVDFVFGGGFRKFIQRKDGRNIFNELEAKGYHISRTIDEMMSYDNARQWCVPFEVDTPLPDERGDMLARASVRGMDLMSKNKKGFFMMIEGSQLDDYGHFNDLPMLMKETLDFDHTIGEVFKWAARDGETLVVITADHETGGLTVHGGDLATGTVKGNFSSKDHTGTMVPVYAFGPGSENFTGFYSNTEIFWKIKRLMNM